MRNLLKEYLENRRRKKELELIQLNWRKTQIEKLLSQKDKMTSEEFHAEVTHLIGGERKCMKRS